MYIADKSKYKAQITDQTKFINQKDYQNKIKRLNNIVEELEKQINEIEKQIKKLIDNDDNLKNQHELLTSIDGVGTKVATKMIVETNAFKDFDDARKFMCHAGVAPFKYTSGTSINSKNKVSNKADKSIKTLLHMSALVVATTKKTGDAFVSI